MMCLHSCSCLIELFKSDKQELSLRSTLFGCGSSGRKVQSYLRADVKHVAAADTHPTGIHDPWCLVLPNLILPVRRNKKPLAVRIRFGCI